MDSGKAVDISHESKGETLAASHPPFADYSSKHCGMPDTEELMWRYGQAEDALVELLFRQLEATR